jgi:hypothetical protein
MRKVAENIENNQPKIPEENTILADFAVEIWRLPRMMEKLMAKIDLDEQKRYESQFGWFNKKAMEFLQSEGITIASLEGIPFDVGMPISPINIDDFNKDDELVIEQVLEPVIIQNGRVLKTGSVILKRVEQ